jgi:hypothetical protein
MAVLVLVPGAPFHDRLPAPTPHSAAWSLAATLAAAFLFAAAAIAAARRARRGAGPRTTAALALAGWLAALTAAAPWVEAVAAPQPFVRALIAARRPGEPVVLERRFVGAVPYALGEPALLLEVPRETAFAPPEDLARVVVDGPAAAARIAAAGSGLVVRPLRGRPVVVGAPGEFEETELARWHELALVRLTPRQRSRP